MDHLIEPHLAPNKSLIFLVGFMGCGKTTLGKTIAQKTGYTFIDLDALIVKEIGMSIADYFAQNGEASFREIEQKTLHKLGNYQTAIIATGGGTPCHFNNMEWMNERGYTVYIKLSAKALLSRLSQKETEARPLLKGKTPEELLTFITEKLEERTFYYEQAKLVYNGLHARPKSLIEQLNL